VQNNFTKRAMLKLADYRYANMAVGWNIAGSFQALSTRKPEQFPYFFKASSCNDWSQDCLVSG